MGTLYIFACVLLLAILRPSTTKELVNADSVVRLKVKRIRTSLRSNLLKNHLDLNQRLSSKRKSGKLMQPERFKHKDQNLSEPKLDKIQDGKKIDHAKRPYMTMILTYGPGFNSTGQMDGIFYIGSLCGGSLLSKKWVVTAAHCFTDNITATSEETGAEVTVVPKEIIILGSTFELIGVSITNDLHHYPKKDRGLWTTLCKERFPLLPDPDIVLIEIPEDLMPLMENVTEQDFIRLPNETEGEMSYFDGKVCHTSGWGEGSGEDLHDAEIKMDTVVFDKVKTTVFNISRDMTRANCHYLYYFFHLPSLPRIDQGDSGGPLACPSDDGSGPVLVALSTFIMDIIIEGDEDVSHADVGHLRLLPFVPWIRALMAGRHYDAAAAPTCHGRDFLCPEGFCLPGGLRCDGVTHCRHRDDELSCHQNSTKNTVPSISGKKNRAVRMGLAVGDLVVLLALGLCFGY